MAARQPADDLPPQREPVPSPVWVAASGDGLVVTTMAGTGKVERIRHTPRVTLRPCTRAGRVEPDAPTVEARASVVDDRGGVRRLTRALVAEYGLLARPFVAADRLRPERQRVVVRLLPPG